MNTLSIARRWGTANLPPRSTPNLLLARNVWPAPARPKRTLRKGLLATYPPISVIPTTPPKPPRHPIAVPRVYDPLAPIQRLNWVTNLRPTLPKGTLPTSHLPRSSLFRHSVACLQCRIALVIQIPFTNLSHPWPRLRKILSSTPGELFLLQQCSPKILVATGPLLRLSLSRTRKIPTWIALRQRPNLTDPSLPFTVYLPREPYPETLMSSPTRTLVCRLPIATCT